MKRSVEKNIEVLEIGIVESGFESGKRAWHREEHELSLEF